MDGSLCGFKWNSALVLQHSSEFISVQWTCQGKTDLALVHKPVRTQPYCKYASELFLFTALTYKPTKHWQKMPACLMLHMSYCAPFSSAYKNKSSVKTCQVLRQVNISFNLVLEWLCVSVCVRVCICIRKYPCMLSPDSCPCNLSWQCVSRISMLAFSCDMVAWKQKWCATVI